MRGPATELIHAGETEDTPATPLTTPIYETTTFVFENAQEVVAYNEGRSTKHLYSRYTNPTVVAAEKKLAALDRAEAALLFSSGQGATTTILLAHLKAGDEIVCGAAIYGGTLHLLEDILAKFGVTPRFVSLEELANPESVIGDRTRVLWFESPINPTLRCVDIARIAKACRARGVLSVIDNTFACPINQQPLALGIDLAMQSVTKYLNGHSDVTGGMEYDRAGPLNAVGFSVSVDLPFHDRNQGNIAQSKVAIAQANEQQEFARSTVLTDVVNAYATFQTSEKVLTLYQSGYLDQAKQSLDITTYVYQQGNGTILDLLDAERTYRSTQLAYRQALAAYMTSVQQINQAVGRQVLQ